MTWYWHTTDSTVTLSHSPPRQLIMLSLLSFKVLVLK